MKYVYVVTRLVVGTPEGQTQIPNLGVYTNYNRAKKHFDSVVSFRVEKGYKLYWTQKYERGRQDYDRVVDAALLEFHYPASDYNPLTFKEQEELRIERWPLYKAEKAKKKA